MKSEIKQLEEQLAAVICLNKSITLENERVLTENLKLKNKITEYYNIQTENKILKKELFKWVCDNCECYDDDNTSKCKKQKCKFLSLIRS